MERLKTNIVPPVGPLDAAICMIGEAPGAEEDFSCEPFVGVAGQLLTRCLRSAGLSKQEVLLTNIFKQRPPNNDLNYYFKDSKNLYPTEEGQEHIEMLRQWLTKLLRERESGHARPQVLVALGAEPMKVLTGKKRIKKWRGSTLPCTLVPGFKVYCCFHPSYVNRAMNEKEERHVQGQKKVDLDNALPLFLIDLDRIQEEALSTEISIPGRRFDISLSHSELLSAIDSLHGERLVACDIETLPGRSGPVVWCIGFAPSESYAFVIPILRGMRYAWSAQEETVLWRAISELWLDPKVTKIFQGGGYDITILGRYYGLRLAVGSYGDTMWCHHASYPYLRKGLEVLASIYTKEVYYKDEGRIGLGSRSDEAEFNYNAKDNCVTREIYPVTITNARELGTYEGYLRTMSVMPSLLGMMIRGVRIDTGRKEELSSEFSRTALQHSLEVNRLSGREWNLNSSAQKQILLYSAEHLNMPAMTHRKTGKLTTDKDALQRLKKKFPQEVILEHILQFQKYAKLSSTYADMEVDVDGRVRTSYGFVSTWRLNSYESHFGGGGNLQNIPVRTEDGRMIRKLFIPDPGFTLLASDRSQAEAMVITWESGDLERMEMYKGGWDVHWFNAIQIFQMPANIKYCPEDVYSDPITGGAWKHSDLRYMGKRITFASYYGMGPFMLQSILIQDGIFFEIALCKKLLALHKARNPLTLQWQAGIREEVKATRTLVTVLGRKRQFLGRFNDQLYRAAYAFRPQSIVGELTELTIQKLWEELREFQPLLNVHDEVVGQCRPAALGHCIDRIRYLSSYPLEIGGSTLDIPVDFKSGPSWGELKEVEGC